MGTINWLRVFLGGVVAAVVALVLEFLITLAFAGQMQELFKVGNVNTFSMMDQLEWMALSLLGGFFMVFLYVVMRGHFGAGPKTAFIGAIYLWLITIPFMGAAMAVLGLLPPYSWGAHAFVMIGTFLVNVAAMMSGAFVYRDKPALAPKVVAAAA